MFHDLHVHTGYVYSSDSNIMNLICLVVTCAFHWTLYRHFINKLILLSIKIIRAEVIKGLYITGYIQCQ